MKPQTKASAKYIKNNVKRIVLNLNINTDQNIIEYMDSIENKQGYLKSLIKKDMEVKIMEKFSLEDLQEWNEEQERDDTLYEVLCRTYRKSQAGYIETTGDCFFAGSNDYNEAMKYYEYCKRMYANDNAVVKLTRAVQVYAGVLEYEAIEKHSTFDESKINNEI